MNRPAPRNRSISMPGETARPEAGLSPEEAGIAEMEARSVPTPTGQDRFNDFVRHTIAQGKDDSGIPEKIFMGATIDERPIVTRQGMRENFRPEMGVGYVPPHVMERFGVNPATEVCRFVHVNNYGEMGIPYLDQWIGDNPSGRVPRDENGKHYFMKGEVLCTLPREVQDSIDADFNQTAKLFEQGRVDDGPGAPLDVRDEDLSMEEIKRRNDETKSVLMEMFANSPTKGKELEDALNIVTAEDEAAMIDRARWSGVGNRDRRPGPAEAAAARPGATGAKVEAENHIDRATEGLKAATKGRSTHAIGAGFDANGNLVRA